ncbi:winged helix DNA-binding domain-containing protein [Actinoplanes sp. NEAU-A12]|uniref:Winged helix DNA-binding domain-containing protein n=1 Tax=Actinoplanes sandaracinus TaxID=3045177 RepID=A0ABT6WQ82_9ACTN|nr:winged helix DNA-binding domain-containing protein [Actinoplanes sandaracinus]MDI6101874.1 winged helix DNA-binding domain-containing protein [Actinoplanes sandaracinus]
MTVLSTRVLNRTFLRRQLLAERTPRRAADIVEHLVAMQGQEPDSPYLGLWARSSDFRLDDLTGLLHDRTVVRSALLRGTQHLCTGQDYRWLRPTLQPALDRFAGRGGRLNGCDPVAFAEAAREILADGVLTRPEIARRLAARFPEVDRGELTLVVHMRFALLHPPPSGTWGHRGRVGCVLAENWLGRPLAAASAETLVWRYLAAFGPASVKDLQVWSGMTRLAALMKELRPRLRVFRDEAGVDLYDLPDAPIEDADSPAPVVFLPEFDNAVLGHSDRTRIIHSGDRPLVMPGWSIVRPTVLVDGFVAATWSRKGATVSITPFRPLAPADRSAVEEEAARLLDFVAPDGKPEVEWV